MSAPKTTLSPAARRKVVTRARFMAEMAGPMIRSMVVEIQDTRHSIASMAEMLVHFIEREERSAPGRQGGRRRSHAVGEDQGSGGADPSD